MSNFHRIPTLHVQNSATQIHKCSRNLFIILRVTVDFCEQWHVLQVTESSTNS